jgi:hypothetical protein
MNNAHFSEVHVGRWANVPNDGRQLRQYSDTFWKRRADFLEIRSKFHFGLSAWPVFGEIGHFCSILDVFLEESRPIPAVSQ